MMKDDKSALTEGMQRLCTVANRIVAAEGMVSRMDRDMLLEALRRLYDVAYEMEVYSVAVPEEPVVGTLSDKTMISSTMMATQAAMAMVGTMAVENEPAEEQEIEVEERVGSESELRNEEVGSKESLQREAVPTEMAAEVVNIAVEEVAPVQAVAHAEVEVVAAPKAPMGALIVDDTIEVSAASAPVAASGAEERRAGEEVATPQAIPPLMEEVEVENTLLFEDEVPVAVPKVEEVPKAAAAVEEPSLFVDGGVEVQPKVAADADEPQVQPKQASLLDYLHRPLGDQPAVRTLGDRLSERVASGVDAVRPKVDDLRNVININDKFSFINELFSADMRAYNDFIVYLNGLPTREVALEYVGKVAQRYGWDEASPTVRTFRKIFDMKF
ncbi:MAG: hypothetical protein IJU19_06185 [Bacteroidales bacterium]|nr:hypothetical protein [Bacteroidales bacterium]